MSGQMSCQAYDIPGMRAGHRAAAAARARSPPCHGQPLRLTLLTQDYRETVSETVPKRHEGDGLGKNEGHHVNQPDELGLG